MATKSTAFFKVGDIRPAENSDFEYFEQLVDGGGWTKKSEKNGLAVWIRSAEDTSIKMFKVGINTGRSQLHTQFTDVTAGTAFDVLMDQDYRSNWDDASITDFDICKLDGSNDIGYYAMKCPAPLKNRDYLNQRSWRAVPDRHYIVFNHSVTHEKYPPLKNFIRGVSYVTGFLVRPSDRGSSLTYVTQSDPKGIIPKWAINFALYKVAPKVIEKLHTACVKYNDWKASNKPGFKPWLHPDQNPLPLYPETLGPPSRVDTREKEYRENEENHSERAIQQCQTKDTDEDLVGAMNGFSNS